MGGQEVRLKAEEHGLAGTRKCGLRPTSRFRENGTPDRHATTCAKAGLETNNSTSLRHYTPTRCLLSYHIDCLIGKLRTATSCRCQYQTRPTAGSSSQATKSVSPTRRRKHSYPDHAIATMPKMAPSSATSMLVVPSPAPFKPPSALTVATRSSSITCRK